MLSRALLLLAGSITLLAATTGCTGLTKPDSISIVAEPAPAQEGAAAPKPGAQVQAQAAAPQRQPAAMPAQANCGE